MSGQQEPRGSAPGEDLASRCFVCGDAIAAGTGRYIHGDDEWCVDCHERDKNASSSPRP